MNRMTTSLEGNIEKYARVADGDVQGVCQWDFHALGFREKGFGLAEISQRACVNTSVVREAEV